MGKRPGSRKLKAKKDVCRAQSGTLCFIRCNGKKVVEPEEKAQLAHHMVEEHGVSCRQVCKAIDLPRSPFSYQPVIKDDSAVIKQLHELVDKHPAIGFWQSFYRIRRKSFVWDHKKVYRVYTGLKLNIRRRYRKRLPARVKQALFQPDAIN